MPVPDVGGIEGRATPEGTRRFALRSAERVHLPPAHFRRAPGGLTLSSIGLGTYIGRPDPQTDTAVEEAVRVCLESGRVNVLDSAINYRYQRAERSVGRAVAHLVDGGRVARDEVFVATKAGYLAPDAEDARTPQRYVEEVLIASGALDPNDIVDGSHAMSPSYLADQLERSRTNLGLATIDLFYLHNAADAQLPVVGPMEFRERLRRAFEFLERRRSDGSIVAYGLATWDSLRLAEPDPRHLDLGSVVELAEEVGGKEHGFCFVQAPFSLAMPEAASVPSQRLGGRRVSLFAAAEALGIGVFTSVPLHQGQLTRGGSAVAGLSPAQAALQFARSAPGNLAALVGQKRADHLAENLEVAGREPWTEAEFRRRLR